MGEPTNVSPPISWPWNFRQFTTPLTRDMLSIEQKMELHRCIMLPQWPDCDYVLDPANHSIFLDPVAEQCEYMPDMEICLTYGKQQQSP
jgi:hypothetical protein